MTIEHPPDRHPAGKTHPGARVEAPTDYLNQHDHLRPLIMQIRAPANRAVVRSGTQFSRFGVGGRIPWRPGLPPTGGVVRAARDQR